jgi:hypothetical protein
MLVGTVAGSVVGQTPALWFGTWRLNVAASMSGPEPLPYKRGTRRITPAENGGVTIVDDLVRSRGGVLHLEWTGKFDGRDYPVQGVEVALTYAYRRLDDRTCELTEKIDGEVVAGARLAISADGRVLTSAASNRAGGVRIVYEKA